MNKNKDLKLDNIEQDFISVDIEKSNNSITDNNTNNNFSVNITENSTKPAIRKTKTTRANSTKKQKGNKKKNSPKKNKKNENKINKKVKFIDKVDIVKVECWKQYNLEQTADECEFIDDYFDDFENGTTNDKIMRKGIIQIIQIILKIMIKKMIIIKMLLG